MNRNTYSDIIEITTHDIDTHNNLKPTSAARMMQEIGTRQMRDRKPTYYEFFFAGMTFIITRMNMEMLKPVHVYDKVRVHTWLCKPKAATLRRCFAIEKDGEICARSYSEWTVANLNSGKLCMAKEVNLSNYEEDEPIDMNLPARFRIPKDLNFEKAGEKTILYSDVDMNMHMNNTYYQNMVWQYIPEIEEKEVTSSSFRFMAEGKYKSTLEIFMAKADCPVDDGLGAEETWYFYSVAKDGENQGRKNIEVMMNVKSARDEGCFKGENCESELSLDDKNKER